MTKRNNTRKRTAAQAKQDDKQRLTTDIFIDRAVSVHGDTYDYSLVDYQGVKNKVVITCKKHGIFEQLPPAHLIGGGCRACMRDRLSDSTDTFIRKSIAIHGINKFGYDKAEYVNARTHVVLVCKVHGEFKTIPTNHLKGQDCMKCAGLARRSGIGKFIKQAKATHANKYDYSLVVYDCSRTNVNIICKIHGIFSQNPQAHINSSGCPKCKALYSGWNESVFNTACREKNNGKGILYVIKCRSKNECFYKVGITSNSVQARFRCNSFMPYDYIEVYTVRGDSCFIYDLEKQLHYLLVDKNYKPKLPFDGMTECFTVIKPVEQLLKKLSDTEQLQLLA